MVVKLLHSWSELRNLLKTPEDFFWMFKFKQKYDPYFQLITIWIFFLHFSLSFPFISLSFFINEININNQPTTTTKKEENYYYT